MDRDEPVTEARAAEAADLDLRTTFDLVELMNLEDAAVPAAVAGARVDIAAVVDPFCAQQRQAFGDIDMLIGIAPRTARVVNANRFISLDLAAHRFRWRERDLAEGNPDAGMQFAGDVDLSGVRERRVHALGFDGVFGCDHALNWLPGASDAARDDSCL